MAPKIQDRPQRRAAECVRVTSVCNPSSTAGHRRAFLLSRVTEPRTGVTHVDGSSDAFLARGPGTRRRILGGAECGRRRVGHAFHVLCQRLGTGLLAPGAELSDELLRVTRLVSMWAGLLGVLLALWLPNVVSALQIFYGLLTAALFVPLVFGLYWKRPGTHAALAAIIAGITSTSCLQVFGRGAGLGQLFPVACGILAGAVTMMSMTLWQKGATAIRYSL